MKQITTIIIIVLFLATIGTTCFIVDSIKNQEITNLKTKYDKDISNLNATISNYENMINGLTLNLHRFDRYRIIGKWSFGDNITNYHNFTFYENNSFMEEEGNETGINTKWGTFEISEVGCIYLNDTFWLQRVKEDIGFGDYPQYYRYLFLGYEDEEIQLLPPQSTGVYWYFRIE